MLNIFYGRESIDKDKFIFKKVNKDERTLILVPDQFTLQGERNAFKYLGISSLMDVEILSPSGMGNRVLKETGNDKREKIGRYGCHMLLSEIIREEKNNLKVFAGMDGKSSFVTLAKNLIADMKQYNTNQEGLKRIVDSLEGDSILKDKLHDMEIIYGRYENKLKDKMLDPEDCLDLVIDSIKESKLIRDSHIWVTGFNTFTPKNLKLMEKLLISALSFNVVLTCDRDSQDKAVFEIANQSVYRFEQLAKDNHIQYRTIEIDDEDCKIKDKSEELKFIEENLYIYPSKKYQKVGENIRFVQGGNPYGEIETAAAYILEQIKSGKYRYRDIAVICNDLESKGSIIQRIFNEYGLKTFIDNKRGVLHNPVVALNLYLLEMASGKFDTESILGYMKTGLTGMEDDIIEKLENYAYKYKIKGNMWKKPFQKGKNQIKEAEFQELEEGRIKLLGTIESFVNTFRNKKTAKDKVKALFFFFREELFIADMLGDLIDYYGAGESAEIALELAQIWKELIEVYQQVVMVMGDEEIGNEELAELISVGFESVELGLLPNTTDEILVGNMQRTRTGEVKILVVIGANEGLLPSNASAGGILSERETALLHEKNAEITRLEEVRAMEEKLGIYKMLSAPKDKLFISYSASDTEGKSAKSSLIYTKLREMFPFNTEEKDIITVGELEALTKSKKSGLIHLTEKLKELEEGMRTSRDEDLYRKSLLIWYRENQREELKKVERGLLFTLMESGLTKEETEALYKSEKSGNFVLSPSRIEKYGRCAFSHFINYGLKPEEKRVFEIAGREIGDIYHLCLMRLSEYLTDKTLPITDENSKWMNVTKEECAAFVKDFIEGEGSVYGDGLLNEDKEAKYRAERMKTVCIEAAEILINHVRQGKIRKIFFEAEFGESEEKPFPAIEVNTDAGKVVIEGKIDRVDILPENYIKIIDYKSGNESFNIEEAKAGWRFQLMLYLKAAMGDSEMKAAKPAGVFYFKLSEPQIDGGGKSGEELIQYVDKEVKKEFRLDGVVVNEPRVLEYISEGIDISEVMATGRRKKTETGNAENDRMLSSESFTEFQEEVDLKLKELCTRLISGKITANPGKVKDETACKFCQYKTICKFDVAFRGCTYRKIR